jgi:hypothetical protein
MHRASRLTMMSLHQLLHIFLFEAKQNCRRGVLGFGMTAHFNYFTDDPFSE